jgi:beta-glucosidase-like glycosyl hydrolase
MSRVILGMREADPSPALRDAIGQGRLGGLLWFREALGASVNEAAGRVARMRAMWPDGVPCLFAVDEEGGLIQQLSGLECDAGGAWRRLPSARALGRSGDVGLAFAHGREVGRRMRAIGLDVALAPVVDLDPGPGSAVLGTRCFSDDPGPVALMALAWLRGLASAGIRGCIKHYPGHGATPVDSHAELPRIGSSVDRERHRFPFEEIARAWREGDGPFPGVLTAHIVRGDALSPATLDPRVISEIPASLGPVWSDSLDMGALSAFGDLETRARAAVTAGVDLLIIGSDIGGGLDLAQKLDVPRSQRVADWMKGGEAAEAPAEWSPDEITRAAAAGFRVVGQADLPCGDWDWILPEKFGPYGVVASPSPSADREAPRRISRVLRYDAGDAGSLRRALERDRSTPALVGLVRRGAADPFAEQMLQHAGARVRAIAHLLDCSADPPIPGIWTCETCGFGEGEIEILRRSWRSGGGDAPAR